LEAVDAFELAEALHSLATEDPVKRGRVARALTRAGASSIAAMRDLNAYEALPADLAQDPETAALARERARSVIEVEYEQLLQAIDDTGTVEVFATDLGERATSYGIEIDIGLILDRADELAAQPDSVPAWPEAISEPDDDADTDVHQIFLQFGDNEQDAEK
jgi:hypothetical protein